MEVEIGNECRSRFGTASFRNTGAMVRALGRQATGEYDAGSKRSGSGCS